MLLLGQGLLAVRGLLVTIATGLLLVLLRVLAIAARRLLLVLLCVLAVAARLLVCGMAAACERTEKWVML